MSDTSNSDDANSVFERETRHRTFKIIVEGKTFFVNPSFLAERSPFFETLLFGDFKEKKEGRAELKDVKAKDFEEFLLVLGADPMKKEDIEASNFHVLANFSHLWDVPSLRRDCLKFLDAGYPAVTVDLKTAIDICAACERIKAPTSVLKRFAAQLGQFPASALVENKAQDLLSPLMSAAVFSASNKRNGCSCVQQSVQPVESHCRFIGCEDGECSAIDLGYWRFCKEHLEEAKDCLKTKIEATSTVKVNLFTFNDGVPLEDIFFPTE